MGQCSTTLTLTRPTPLPKYGVIEVTTRSTGEDIDLSGYVIRTDFRNARIGLGHCIELRDAPEGPHTIQLDDLAANCSVDGGPNREIVVSEGETSSVAFEIVSEPLAPAAVNVTALGPA